ncbi:Uncharacterized protein APZ42_028718 [Daphnia magna]|uniref:Uncharacterized protein n=1 Tax=Daphnia magna TaxID=35525 RepID=A0A164QB25_9CRUS|nr:Uncharacterized protein APZ42_028718 [Daphnia magna]
MLERHLLLKMDGDVKTNCLVKYTYSHKGKYNVRTLNVIGKNGTINQNKKHCHRKYDIQLQRRMFSQQEISHFVQTVYARTLRPKRLLAEMQMTQILYA